MSTTHLLVLLSVLLAAVVIAVLAVALDQRVKWLCTEHLTEGEPVRILGGLVYLSLLRNGGAALNITSVRADLGINAGYSAYVAAKGAIASLTRQWATEWAKYGIRVNALAPGGIASSGFDTYTEEDRAFFREQAVPVIPPAPPPRAV